MKGIAYSHSFACFLIIQNLLKNKLMLFFYFFNIDLFLNIDKIVMHIRDDSMSLVYRLKPLSRLVIIVLITFATAVYHITFININICLSNRRSIDP